MVLAYHEGLRPCLHFWGLRTENPLLWCSIHGFIVFGNNCWKTKPLINRSTYRKGKTRITQLSETGVRATLISRLSLELEWRNWQTQQTQNLPPVTRRGGSTPPSSTKFFGLESARYKPLFSRVPSACPRLLPRARRFVQIRFQLLLSRTNPRDAMPDSNSHDFVPPKMNSLSRVGVLNGKVSKFNLQLCATNELL